METRSYIVPPEIFKDYSPDQKLNTLFHYVSTLHDNSEIQKEAIQELRKRKLVNKGIAMLSGGIGGAVAITFKHIYSFLLTK